jgi:hypothetical protein
VIARPFGVTFPFRVAPVAPTEVADKVETVGGFPGEEVVKLTIRSLEVLLPFSAQNWKLYIVPDINPFQILFAA